MYGVPEQSVDSKYKAHLRGGKSDARLAIDFMPRYIASAAPRRPECAWQGARSPCGGPSSGYSLTPRARRRLPPRSRGRYPGSETGMCRSEKCQMKATTRTAFTLALPVAAFLAGLLAMAGCGEESSNGGLCQRCGDNFGICQPDATIEVGPDTNAPSFCTVPSPGGSPVECQMQLACRSEIDNEAVHRCYPVDPATAMPQVDAFYRCDGFRPVAG